MPRIFPLAAMLMITFTLATPVKAGSHAYYCADASGQFQYDGQQLTWRDNDKPKVTQKLTSRKISETLIATDEKTCINKGGDKFVSASKTYLVVLEYPNPWSKGLAKGQFLCNEDFDSYPNSNDIDTKCVKTVTKTGRLKNATLVTRKKAK